MGIESQPKAPTASVVLLARHIQFEAKERQICLRLTSANPRPINLR